MPMKKFFLSLFLPALFFSAGCSEEEDVLGKQKSNMVSFLERTHRPQLIPEEDYEEGSRLPFYTTSGDAVYRYIDQEDYFNPDRDNWPVVTENSWATITFTAYVFTNSAITGLPDGGLNESNFSRVTMPYYSNDPAFITYFRLAGLTLGAWDFEPLAVDMRDPGIIKGLRLALLGCREGDRVEAYMTYNMAYGDKTYMYFLPKETPVAIFFSVDKVE